MKKALVLAGHGSHISPQTAGLVWQQVDKLRALGVADEVTAAFWKEMPYFSRVIDTLKANDVTIVPLFTAQGYFTRNVIPAEMGLTGALTIRDGRTLRYARTLGEHPFLGEVVQRRVEDMLVSIGSSPDKVGVALIGHGTKRNPTSRAVTEAQAQRLRELNLVGEVAAVYLDDTPAIPDVYTLLKTPIIIAVPNFLALGSHTTIDVPEALGLTAGESTGKVHGRTVYYTEPIGTDAALTQAIIELAAEAGAELSPQAHDSAWVGFPTAGRAALLRAVHERGEMRFGQLILTPHEVRTEGQIVTTFEAPDTLREHVRTIPAFRPLATTSDLPGGWHVLVSWTEQLHAVVETVYPGATAAWAAQRRGTLNLQSLAEVVTRQHGMFRALADFDAVEQQVNDVCGRCVCRPVWFHGGLEDDSVPCGEACNWWMSKAMEAEA